MRKLDKRAKKSSKFKAERKNKPKFDSKKPSFKSREQLTATPRSGSRRTGERKFGSRDEAPRARTSTRATGRFDSPRNSSRAGRPRFSDPHEQLLEKDTKPRFEKRESSFRGRDSEGGFKGKSDSRFERPQRRSGRPSSSSSFSNRGNDRAVGRPRKQSSRGKYIDERLFVNKATTKTEIEVYEPKNTFADFKVAKVLAKNLESRGYIKPSPIQDQSIPVALSGKDVIGIAATGTGKTAAFLIPLINKLEMDRKQKVMILTPTRELAQQIQDEFMNFTTGMKLFSVTCVGGMPIFPQMRQLTRGVHVVIGTPGRVQDLMRRGKIKMSEYNSIVLDEADRMLDMGFIEDMREILSEMPKDKHGLFFSATFDNKIKDLCSDFLNNPVTVSVKTRDTSGSVDQDVVRVLNRNDKIEQLHKILNSDGAKKVLIFREMKKSVDELTMELKGRGITALGLHGDMRNRERERAVQALKDGKIQALIATDVAARGIHISDISHVINYDIPNDYETYIHRIGRTGRGEAKGIALTFI